MGGVMRAAILAFLCCAGVALADPVQIDRQPVPKMGHACGGAALKALTKPVTVGFRITAKGNVGETVILESSGSEAGDQAATECIKNWTYDPALKGGVPVDFLARITLRSEFVRDLNSFDDQTEYITLANASPEAAKALVRLIQDAQRRCPDLYWVELNGDIFHARNRIVARRLGTGEIETSISRSSPVSMADTSARRCVTNMIGRHKDLPPAFAVEIEIDWARYADDE
jgi:TonB family protein